MKTTTISEYSVENKYKVLGFNDDECTCDICGKSELKGTYAIEDLSNGEIFRAGSSCGAKMAGWTTKELVKKYNLREKEILDIAKKEFCDSKEYISYEKAIDFLNKESDDLQRKLWNCSDENLRKQIYSTERTFESRREFIKSFSENLDVKRKEIMEKYKVKYIN